MTAFHTAAWHDTLVKIYVRASIDYEYRVRLTDRDPTVRNAAIHEVDPDIEIPDWFQFGFFEDERDLFYSYLLPPYVEPATLRRLIEEGGDGGDLKKTIKWGFGGGITHPTTNQ